MCYTNPASYNLKTVFTVSSTQFSQPSSLVGRLGCLPHLQLSKHKNRKGPWSPWSSPADWPQCRAGEGLLVPHLLFSPLWLFLHWCSSWTHLMCESSKGEGSQIPAWERLCGAQGQVQLPQSPKFYARKVWCILPSSPVQETLLSWFLQDCVSSDKTVI